MIISKKQNMYYIPIDNMYYISYNYKCKEKGEPLKGDKVMKLFYNGKVIGEITTNHRMTTKEALWCLGYDLDDKEDLKKAYKDGFEPSYIDDDNQYCIDVDGIEFE